MRFPHTNDKVNNPEIPQELTAEKEAVQKLEGVTYFNLGTDQVPTQETVDKFLEIMDEPSNYPVLVHCYHGVGRAQLFSAIYRMEYEGWSNWTFTKNVSTGNMKIYLNGSLWHSGTGKTKNIAACNSMYIGSYGSSYFFSDKDYACFSIHFKF